jgi:hypothetical protein
MVYLNHVEGGGELMDKKQRINEINDKINKLLKDAQYADSFDEKRNVNDKLLELVIEWEALTGEIRPSAQNLVGYFGYSQNRAAGQKKYKEKYK